MQQSASERVTGQFYQWEQLGRGWLYHRLPVQLEPPFIPFFRTPNVPKTVKDDGRRHTIFSWAIKSVKNAFKTKEQEMPEEESEPAPPILFECNEPLRILSVSLPKGSKVGTVEAEQLLLMLSDSQYPISFEIVAANSSIVLQIACRACDMPLATGQVKAYFPELLLKNEWTN